MGAATDEAGPTSSIDHVGGPGSGDLFPATWSGARSSTSGCLAGRRSTVDLDRLSLRRLRVQGTTFSIRTAEERAEVYAALP